MNKLEAIAAAKQFRKDADELLQRLKAHRIALAGKPTVAGEEPIAIDVLGEVLAQHTISQRDLESVIMRQGMVLKNIGGPNPYPESYNPASPVVDPTADGLKL